MDKTDCKKCWKYRKVKWESEEEFEIIYTRYKDSKCCELCGIEYKTSFYKCLDHCHDTGKFRNIICRTCNLNVGKQKINNNTGHNNISKINNKRYKLGFYYRVRIERYKVNIFEKTRTTLEKAIECRDKFIAENPTYFT